MVAFSRTCPFSVRPRAFSISDPPERLLTLILRCSAADLPPAALWPYRSRHAASVPLRLLLLQVKFNRPVLNLGDESAPFGYQHPGAPRIGRLGSNIGTVK